MLVVALRPRRADRPGRSTTTAGDDRDGKPVLASRTSGPPHPERGVRDNCGFFPEAGVFPYRYGEVSREMTSGGPYPVAGPVREILRLGRDSIPTSRTPPSLPGGFSLEPSPPRMCGEPGSWPRLGDFGHHRGTSPRPDHPPDGAGGALPAVEGCGAPRDFTRENPLRLPPGEPECRDCRGTFQGSAADAKTNSWTR